MKVIAYLAFTLLSILIQFCVMDLTQDKINLGVDQVEFNTTNQKMRFEELLKSLTQKPHALYYRTQGNSKLTVSSTKVPRNVQETDTTTISTTIIDELYDENVSTTEDAFTTEALDTNGEYDNVTEISFFDKKNRSVTKPGTSKKAENKDCGCNLLYQVCDINCCCDSDCSDIERNLFISCNDISKRRSEDTLNLCYAYNYLTQGAQDNIVDNLFCIAKLNIPQKRKINQKQYDITAINRSYKWHRLGQPKHTQFERKPYVYGEPVWVLKEGSIWYIDIPSPSLNNYCSGRKPILFLNNINVKCTVDINELEVFQILRTSREAPCISVTGKSLNSTGLNCSTLHCTNWTTVICDNVKCVDYNESIHEPSCSEEYCTNIALKLQYIFYYSEDKILNATIKLYTEKLISFPLYMVQEVSVKFILSNQSIDKVTEFSGNRGYIHGRPVIVSYVESNRSLHFLNVTSVTQKYLLHPDNKNRICTVSNTNPESNLVLFGLNKRVKCRFTYNSSLHLENSTNLCSEIERQIEQKFGFTRKTYVSPYGKPLDIKDRDWIPLQTDLYEKEITYGIFLNKKSKLRCYNIVNRMSYVFAFADVSDNNFKREYKIVSAKMSVTAQNLTFNVEDVSAVLTIDINFLDGTKLRTFEYAAGPYINVNLPKDFFFPFKSSATNTSEYLSVILMLIMLCISK